MSAPGFPMSASPPGLVPPAPNDPTAVIGSRVVAGLIDGLLFLLMLLFVAPGPLSPLAEYAENTDDLSQDEACDLVEQNDDVASGMCLVIGDRVYWTDSSDRAAQIAVEFGFIAVYILWQGITGLTPGKLLLGLRTVGTDGKAPGIGRSFLRTALWIVDGFPYCLPLVGFITALTSTAHRRVGDMAAATFVVSKRDAGTPVVVPGYSTGAPAPTGPVGPATAPFGTPTVYPNTPPYQPTSQPTAGGWGGPPTAPMPGWGTPPPTAPAAPPVAPQIPAMPPIAPAAPEPPAPTPNVPFGAGADPADFEATAPAPTPAPPTEPVAEPAPEAPEAPEAAEAPEAPEAPTDDTPAEGTPAEPEPDTSSEATSPGPVPTTAPTEEAPAAPEAEAAGTEAPPAEETPDEPPTPTSGDSPYQPQWDAARGAYIQWDPNRSRWLQWDDTAKEWNPI